MKRKFAALVGAVALFAAAPTTATAATNGEAGATGLSSCPSTYACFWVNTNYSGTMGKVAGNNPNYTALSNSSGCPSGTWNDCISSIANRGTQCTVYFYQNANYSKSARWHSLSRGDQVANFGTGYNDPGFNDVISSNRWCTS